LKDEFVKDGDILKADSFLNHQIDIDLLDKAGMEFKRCLTAGTSSVALGG